MKPPRPTARTRLPLAGHTRTLSLLRRTASTDIGRSLTRTTDVTAVAMTLGEKPAAVRRIRGAPSSACIWKECGLLTLCFGLCQGMEPRLTEKLRRLRDLKVGLAIALDCEKGKTRTEAVKDASAQFLISEKTVWRLWSTNKDFVTKTLENFRTPITSGSVENDPET